MAAAFLPPGNTGELRIRAACFFSVMQGLGIPLQDQGFSDLLAFFGTDAKGSSKSKSKVRI